MLVGLGVAMPGKATKKQWLLKQQENQKSVDLEAKWRKCIKREKDQMCHRVLIGQVR